MKLLLILFLLIHSIVCGPITAYTVCTSCCGIVHSPDFVIPFVGLSTTSWCVLEACIAAPVSLPIVTDPRDLPCATAYYASLLLPTP